MLPYLPPESNFLGIDTGSSNSTANIAIQPLPLERTVSYGTGTINGPEEILKASHYVEYYDDEFDRELCFECGIATLAPLRLDDMPLEVAISTIKNRIKKILNVHRFCIALGGEHTITLPVIEGHLHHFPNLSVLQFDAHADLRREYNDSPLSHACVMARVAELIRPTSITQVGIRALSKEEAVFIKQSGINTYHAYGIRQGLYGVDWTHRVVDHLGEYVYITFDVDVLDPAILPATGTPEPEGLMYSECMELVRNVVKTGRRIIGFDVVELAPIPAFHHPNLTTARIVYKLLNIAFAHERALEHQ